MPNGPAIAGETVARVRAAAKAARFFGLMICLSRGRTVPGDERFYRPGAAEASEKSDSGRQQLANDELEDAAVAVVLELDRRIDPRDGRERLLRAVRSRRRDRQGLPRDEAVGRTADRVD